MKNFYYKLKYAIRIGWMVFKNPRAYQESMFKIVGTLFEQIEQASKASTPLYTKIVVDLPDEEAKTPTTTLVTLWLSTGISPVERAIELAKEKKELQEQVKYLLYRKKS